MTIITKIFLTNLLFFYITYALRDFIGDSVLNSWLYGAWTVISLSSILVCILCMGGFMNYFIDFKQFRQEYQELIGQGKTYEQAMEILTEL